MNLFFFRRIPHIFDTHHLVAAPTKPLAVAIESVVCVLMFQVAFRWPGIFGGALEAVAVLLLPVLLVRAMYRDRHWWLIWLLLFVSVMSLTIWMPPTIASKGGIPIPLSWLAGLLLWAYDSLPPLLALLFARSLWKKIPNGYGFAAAACMAALIMVVCDTWLLHIYPWTWATPLASPPLLGRAAAFLGTEGFTAIIWIHGVLTGCFLATGALRKTVISSVATLAFLFVLSSAWHFLPRDPEMTMDIAIVQPNYPVNTYIPNQLADMWQRSDTLLRENDLPKKEKPTLLLWPESSVTDGNYLLPDLDLSEYASSRNVSWLFGTDGWIERYKPFNIVRGEVAGKNGPFIQEKVIPMPFGERMPGPKWMRNWLENFAKMKSWEAGDIHEVRSFQVRVNQYTEISVHPLICSEALIPRRVRAGMAAGSNILTEHTNDAWFETSLAADLHASMVRLRALESGVPLVRSTLSGRSGWVRENGTWQHVSDVMSEGAWSFELKWRPIRTPARTPWPFYCLQFLLISCAIVFIRSAIKRKSS